jgi:DNA-binding CsgD family transcriptional regulator
MASSEVMHGERSLMCAVLEDAVRCLTGEAASGRERRRLAMDARAWFEERNEEWPFSFDSICAALDLDAGPLRSRLLTMAPEIVCTDEPDEPARRGCRARVNQAEIVEMIRAGHSLRAVADTFGISVPTVSTLSGRLASRMRAERDGEIRRLRGEGWTMQALAARFELSRIRVMRICARRDGTESERTQTAA